MNFGELIAKGGALFARKGADALADTLETAPPADLVRIQASVSGDRAKLNTAQQEQQAAGATTALLNSAKTALKDPGGGADIQIGGTGSIGVFKPIAINVEEIPNSEDPAYKVLVIDFGALSGLVRLSLSNFHYDEQVVGSMQAACYKYPKGSYGTPSGMYAGIINGSYSYVEGKGVKAYWAVKDIDASNSSLCLIIEHRSARLNSSYFMGMAFSATAANISPTLTLNTSLASSGLFSYELLFTSGGVW